MRFRESFLARHRAKNRLSRPAEARAWNCTLSTSTEIAAHSRFQPINRCAATGGPSFFTAREHSEPGSEARRPERARAAPDAGKPGYFNGPGIKWCPKGVTTAEHSEFSRREFLRSGLESTAGAAAFSGIIFLTHPERVLGANDRVRVAVCGVHGRGPVQRWGAPRRRLSASCGTCRVIRASTGQGSGAPCWARSWRRCAQEQ